MRNSKTLYTGSDSKDEWDALKLTAGNTFVGAGSATVEGTSTMFPRCRSLAMVTNPKTNRGVVHLIKKIYLRVVATCSVGGVATIHVTVAQIRRRQRTGTMDVLIDNRIIDEVVWEDTIQAPASVEAAGAGTQLVTDVYQASSFDLENDPIICVRPYWLDFRSAIAVEAAAIVNVDVTVYLRTQSVRVEGEKYRRLLDAYTQVPWLIEKRDDTEAQGEP